MLTVTILSVKKRVPKKTSLKKYEKVTSLAIAQKNPKIKNPTMAPTMPTIIPIQNLSSLYLLKSSIVVSVILRDMR